MINFIQDTLTESYNMTRDNAIDDSDMIKKKKKKKKKLKKKRKK